MDWLRAKMHLFPLVFLALALVALGIDWALSAPTRQETLITAILGLGGLTLFGLKWRVTAKRRKAELDD